MTVLPLDFVGSASLGTYLRDFAILDLASFIVEAGLIARLPFNFAGGEDLSLLIAEQVRLLSQHLLPFDLRGVAKAAP